MNPGQRERVPTVPLPNEIGGRHDQSLEFKLRLAHRRGDPVSFIGREFFPDIELLKIKMLAKKLGNGRVFESALLRAARKLARATSKTDARTKYFPDLEHLYTTKKEG